MNNTRDLISTLHSSHTRLASLVEPLSPAQVSGPSYAKEWTIAQVLSHLGSGAEVFGKFLDAGLSVQEPPGQDAFPPIWDAWNAKAPVDQASDGLRHDAAFVARLEALSDDELASVQMNMFGMDVDAARLIQMRLGEHVVHTWDIAVALDPAATLPSGAAEVLVDSIGFMAGRVGKAPGTPLRVHIRTTDPEREFVLVADEAVEIAPVDGKGAVGTGADSGSAGRLELPAESLVRLVYGRLDADHTPAPLVATGVDLDALRAIFPGV